MIRTLLLVAAALVLPVGTLAQTETPNDDGGFSLTPELDLDATDLGDVEAVEQPQAALAQGAILRGLDRVTGDLTDLEMTNGQTQSFGRLSVTLGECRFPAGNPSGDAYAFLVIQAEGVSQPVFEGWMIASSPALNALDHARYDVWVLRCTTS